MEPVGFGCFPRLYLRPGTGPLFSGPLGSVFVIRAPAAICPSFHGREGRQQTQSNPYRAIYICETISAFRKAQPSRIAKSSTNRKECAIVSKCLITTKNAYKMKAA